MFSFAQSNDIQELNLGFEQIENGHPVKWKDYNEDSYLKAIDSLTVHSGKYSALIEFVNDNTDFMSWTYSLPENYNGKEITLSGYVKTENVSDGFACLWMRIDYNIAFDNMSDNWIIGTNDWERFEITLQMNPENTEAIAFGGLLAGKGKIWLDDFQITIDGKDIENCKPYYGQGLPADLDQEFKNGSGFTLDINTLGDFQLENLETLGYVWGFLKYYHPNIAKGDFNWDFELFRILPQIINVSSTEGRDKLFVEWIRSLGKFKKTKLVEKESQKIKMNPQLDWITNSNFSNDLELALLDVKSAKRNNSNYYLGKALFVGNPIYKNEKPYSRMQMTDQGFKILTLFKYWNIIQYTFPYKYLIEDDWSGVIKEFLPIFIQAGNRFDYTMAILELVSRVNDSHATISNGSSVLWNYYGIYKCATDVAFVDDQVVVLKCYDQSLDKESMLQPGDIITHIGDVAVIDEINKRLKFTSASNYPTKLRNLESVILRSNDSILNITYNRDGVSKNICLKTYKYDELSKIKPLIKEDTCFKLLTKDIGYINHGELLKSDISIIWKEIKKTKGLIIDIRNYPSDFPIYKFSNYLMSRSTEFAKFSSVNLKIPGQFEYSSTVRVGGGNSKEYKGKIIIIVNEDTQSSAEFHAMAYRTHPNAIVIGSTTAGADGNVSAFYLPGGIKTKITGIGVYYPDGGETQQVGIIPDIVVKPTVQGIKEGRDELLEKAIELIEE